MIHGDYKTANIFFSRDRSWEAPSSGSGDPQADPAKGTALIDWQWTGIGMGASDIIYLQITSMDTSCLERCGQGQGERQVGARCATCRGTAPLPHKCRSSSRSESEILDVYHKFLCFYLEKRGVSPSTYTRNQLGSDHTAAAAECTARRAARERTTA